MEQTTILSILRSKETVFTLKEIALASNEKKPSLLKKRLNYYVQKGELYHIRRGLYAKDKNYDKLELATKIFTPSYVSFETILIEAGVIFQHYNTIFVATYQSKNIVCDGHYYSFKKIKDTILTNNSGVENKGNYFAASKERAFLDILYLNKDYHFDNLSPLDLNKINMLLPIYNNKRMTRAVRAYFKAFEKENLKNKICCFCLK
jgi:predicted transcriptional regulator of viral defense system